MSGTQAADHRLRMNADTSIHRQYLAYVANPNGPPGTEPLTVAMRFFRADRQPPARLVWDRMVGYATAADVRGRPSVFDLSLAYACGWRGPDPTPVGAPA